MEPAKLLSGKLAIHGDYRSGESFTISIQHTGICISLAPIQSYSTYIHVPISNPVSYTSSSI